MGTERRGIAGAGNWIIDHLYICDRWPREETLSNILEEDRGTGGAPYNCLLDLAKFGPGTGPYGPAPGARTIPLEAIGLTGNDADGEFIRRDMARHGIDASALAATDDAPTSYTNVMVVQGTGRRTFFHNRGANALFSPQDVPVGKIRASIFHMGYLMLCENFIGKFRCFFHLLFFFHYKKFVLLFIPLDKLISQVLKCMGMSQESPPGP